MADIATEEKAFLASDKLKDTQKKLATLGIELVVDVNSVHALQVSLKDSLAAIFTNNIVTLLLTGRSLMERNHATCASRCVQMSQRFVLV